MVFRERTYAVLLVTASSRFTTAMAPLLPGKDFYPITTVKSIGDARRRITERPYDLIIINAPLPDGGEEAFAKDLAEKTTAGILLLVKKELHEEIMENVLEYGILTAGKPSSTPVIQQSLRALCVMRERLGRVAEKQRSVEEKIQEIRLINRAKWLLITKVGISEEDAHHEMERRAMAARCSKVQIATEMIRQYSVE